MTPVLLNEFSDDHPFTVTELNTVLRALAGAVNSLAGTQMVQINPAGGDLNTDYVPVSGGDYTGTITAPAILVGPYQGSKFPVVTQNTPAQLAVPGAVRQAALVANLTQTLSGTYQQAEVTAIQTALNALLTALKNAGIVAAS